MSSLYEGLSRQVLIVSVERYEGLTDRSLLPIRCQEMIGQVLTTDMAMLNEMKGITYLLNTVLPQ